MARRELPVSVVHFDCFGMREFNWCDFEWDPRVFPKRFGIVRVDFDTLERTVKDSGLWFAELAKSGTTPG
jgi:alpha-glucosidase (family GH31 glycosyl hydrolase)